MLTQCAHKGSDGSCPLCPTSLHVGELRESCYSLRSFSVGEKELVVLGDFGSPPQSSELDILRKEKLCPLVPSTQFTNISTRSPQGTRCLDNIWLSRSLKKIYSGRRTVSEVVLDSLVVRHFDARGRKNSVMIRIPFHIQDKLPDHMKSIWTMQFYRIRQLQLKYEQTFMQN